MNRAARHRYILRVTLGYALFATLWIFLSDSLLATFIDLTAIRWLSTAKGMAFVIVTTMLLFLALRGIPGTGAPEPDMSALDAILSACAEPMRWRQRVIYAFAVVATVATLLLRVSLGVSIGERPMLILFMFPIILSALFGGLGPGLVSTVLAAAGTTYFFVPSAHGLWVSQPLGFFQWSFLAVNGVLVSLLSEALHRWRRRTDASHRWQAVTLASIGDAVITTDAAGHITYLNPQAERLTGWTAPEATGQPLTTVFRLIDEQTRRPMANPAQTVLGSGRAVDLTNNTLLVARDGREWPIHHSATPIRLTDHMPLGVALVFRDDTERRRAERALRDSEEFNRAIMDSVASEIAVLDPAGVIVAVNEPWRRFALDNSPPGQPAQNTDVGVNYLRICNAEVGPVSKDAALACGGIDAVMAGRTPSFSLEYPCHSPDRQRWFTMTATPLGQNGKGVVITHADITPRKQAELALKESENRLRLALASAVMGVWEWMPATGEVYWSPECHAIFGRPDCGGRTEDFTALLHPDDVDQVMAAAHAAIDQRSLLSIEFRIVRPGGEVVWVSNLGRADYDESGRPLRLVGIVQDIDDRKRAEAALRDSEAKFRRLFDVAPVPMGLADRNNVVLALNERFVRTFGYSREDMPTLERWWQLAYPDSDYRRWARDAWEGSVRRAVEKNADIEPEEYRVVSKDGEVRTLVVSGSAFGEDHLAAFFDITERKRAEDALKESEEKLRVMADAANDAIVMLDEH
ncbi:PAS domain S-box protein, partial [Methylomagnum sp.]